MGVPSDSNIVIFGASGDLTFRKLVPALYHLFVTDQLSSSFFILGVGRSSYSDDEFRSKLSNNMLTDQRVDEVALTLFLQHVYYVTLNTSTECEYVHLKAKLASLYQQYNVAPNTLFYLATPPSLFGVIPKCLAAHQLNDESEGWKRLVVEKPLGYDLKSAIDLDTELHRYFDEQQIYRIDHYLGKETVQNLLVFRFANGMFEPLWTRNYIDYVEITGAEQIGVEGRGGYYDGSGALRDMLQNHLLQVLAMTTMEPPVEINADSIRNEVVKVLKSLQPLTQEGLAKDLVLGQYRQKNVNGETLRGYLEEKGVGNNSRTETYVGLRLFINNWRWNGVPFYIRTGKRLPTRVTEIVIHFHKTPHPVFGVNAPANKLIIRIQPNEGIVTNFSLKKPGAGFEAKEVSMDFKYEYLDSSDGDARLLSAYERLLLDALNGDATLFARSDAVQACWKFVQPVLEYKENQGQIFDYPCGSWGPTQADALLAQDGRAWRKPCAESK